MSDYYTTTFFDLNFLVFGLIFRVFALSLSYTSLHILGTTPPVYKCAFPKISDKYSSFFTASVICLGLIRTKPSFYASSPAGSTISATRYSSALATATPALADTRSVGTMSRSILVQRAGGNSSPESRADFYRPVAKFVVAEFLLLVILDFFAGIFI